VHGKRHAGRGLEGMAVDDLETERQLAVLGRGQALGELLQQRCVPALAAQQPYVLHVLILTCLYAIPAVGLNLMLGYTGLVSLGHMAFAGVGAYTAAVLMVDAGWSFWLALAAVIATSVGLAIVIWNEIQRLFGL